MDCAQATSGREWPLIRRLIGPLRGRALGVLTLVLLDTALASLGVGMVFPVFQAFMDPTHDSPLLRQYIPALLGLAPESRLMIVAMATILLFALKATVTLLTTVTTNKLLQELRFNWVARIGESYLYGPYRLVAGQKPGELLNDWFTETQAATRFFQSSIAFLSSATLVLALVVLGALVDWRVMSVMLLFGCGIATLGRRKLFGGSAQLSKTKVALNQALSASMIENLTHVRDLKLLQAEASRLASLDGVCRRLARAVLKGAVFADIPRVAGEFLAVLALMAFVMVCVTVLKRPPVELLPLMAFFFIAFYRLVSAGSMAAAARVKALNELHSVVVVGQLLAYSGEREDRGEGEALEGKMGGIELRAIHYGYDADQPVLAGVTATFPQGKTILLAGPSGSGKSTLLDLLMRLDEPQQGRIEVGGKSAAAYRLVDWRRQFGYVSQEAALFHGDIRMNLRLADPGVSDGDLEQACRLAGADEFIRLLPHGYETLVGERGHSLSGGQRKRIAIARALLRKPSVLILDEATTSFEQSLEQSMLSGLRGAMPEMTIIQISHRLLVEEGIDWVVALQDGKVAAQGSLEDVRPHLAQLVTHQQGWPTTTNQELCHSGMAGASPSPETSI